MLMIKNNMIKITRRKPGKEWTKLTGKYFEATRSGKFIMVKRIGSKHGIEMLYEQTVEFCDLGSQLFYEKLREVEMIKPITKEVIK